MSVHEKTQATSAGSQLRENEPHDGACPQTKKEKQEEAPAICRVFTKRASSVAISASSTRNPTTARTGPTFLDRRQPITVLNLRGLQDDAADGLQVEARHF